MKNLPNLNEMVVITDDKSGPMVKQTLPEALQKKAKDDPTLQPQLAKLKVIVEPTFLSRGQIQQTYSKMTSDLHTTSPYILHLDSDVYVTHWDDSCWLRQGLPVLEYQSFATLPEEVAVWRNGSEKLLQRSVEFEFSRRNQHVYPRELYGALRSHLEAKHKHSFADIFSTFRLVGRMHDHRKDANSTLVSDFNLMGAFAYYFRPELMEWVDLGSPGAQPLPLCIRQCNARLLSLECCQWFYKYSEGAHVDCKACGSLPEEHPCLCNNLRVSERKKKDLIEAGKAQLAAAAPAAAAAVRIDLASKRLWVKGCRMPSGTSGWQCQQSFCYGSQEGQSCKWIADYLREHGQREAADQCQCPDPNAPPPLTLRNTSISPPPGSRAASTQERGLAVVVRTWHEDPCMQQRPAIV